MLGIFYILFNLTTLMPHPDECHIMPGKFFIDLGSGVGQVCMFVASLSRPALSIGIEIMPVPCGLGERLLRLYTSRAQKHGIATAPIRLLHGDFLINQEIRDSISNAGLVYMNNVRFGAELNLKVLGTQLCFAFPVYFH